MTPVDPKHTIKHDPENGAWGNCMQMTLAALLDMPIADVPHFMDGGDPEGKFNENVVAFLATRNLARVMWPISGDFMDSANIMEWHAAYNPDSYYMLTGKSRNGTPHVVLCLNDQIVHDNHGAGIVAPCESGNYWLEWVVSTAFKVDMQ
jgi:hypothetical protein